MLTNKAHPRYTIKKKVQDCQPKSMFLEKITDKNGEILLSFNNGALFGNGIHTYYAQVEAQDKRKYQASKELLIVTDTPIVEVYHRFLTDSNGVNLSLSAFVIDLSGYPVGGAVTCSLFNSSNNCVRSDSGNTVNGVSRFSFHG
jgi:hypothetical protein